MRDVCSRVTPDTADLGLICVLPQRVCTASSDFTVQPSAIFTVLEVLQVPSLYQDASVSVVSKYRPAWTSTLTTRHSTASTHEPNSFDQMLQDLPSNIQYRMQTWACQVTAAPRIKLVA